MIRTFRIPVPVDGVYEGDVLGAFVWLKVPGLSGKVGVQVGDVEEMTPVPPAMPVAGTGRVHKRQCANCRHVGPLREGWRWCCWNPIGCECEQEGRPKR